MTPVIGQTKPKQAANQASFSAFRYVIIANTTDFDEDRMLAGRSVEVLMDGQKFSEGNLRSFFSLISTRFPDPRLLYVTVYTSLEQAPTPEERDKGGASEMPDDGKNGKYLWALYIRNGDDEFFRYSPKKNLSDTKTVQISKP
ncbi:MAG: hypothetical protein AB7J13_10100 [Pyrinomonadaceae bacterium]